MFSGTEQFFPGTQAFPSPCQVDWRKIVFQENIFLFQRKLSSLSKKYSFLLLIGRHCHIKSLVEDMLFPGEMDPRALATSRPFMAFPTIQHDPVSSSHSFAYHILYKVLEAKWQKILSFSHKCYSIGNAAV